MNNNTIYKKLRVALSLNDEQCSELFKYGDLDVSKSRMHSWRVGPDHKHFRPMMDNELSAFLDGMINVYRKDG